MQLLHSTKFVNLVENNGWTWATRKPLEELPNRKADYVAICPTIYNGKESRLVLISEYRESLKSREWSVPAGLIDANETVLEAAKRELFEETGLAMSVVHMQTPLMPSSAGITDELGYIIFAEAEGEITNRHAESNEDIQVHSLSIQEVDDLLGSNTFVSKNAVMACIAFIMGRALASALDAERG